MSHLKSKSEVLSSAAELLHERGMYPAVAHSAYYSCYQLVKHIWLRSMSRTEAALRSGIGSSKMGSHQYLTTQVILYIESLGKRDCRSHAREVARKMAMLKRLRTDADYCNAEFSAPKSSQSISLSSDIAFILRKY
ncbi:MAG: hypothetical protein LBL94_11295 [Prevotellaceae bacterium]|jgi:uncharacterized protein (UPF0332 family)|nr:hypothetical protein [Prevotellaceae bacterium]